MRDRRSVFVSCLALLIAAPLTAGELDVSVLPGSIPGSPHATGGELSLGLDDAYALALSRNLDLQVGRFDVAQADTDIGGAIGLFDPELTAGVNGDYRKSPAATQLAGAEITESRNTQFSLGVSQLLPTGTALSAETSMSRSETNSSFFYVNPSWSSDFTLSVNQPLLNGFGTLVNRSGLIIARNAREQTATGFVLQVVSTLGQVENAYWNLVSARRTVEVRERSLALAEQLLDETKERIRVGTAAPIETVQSEATVAARRQELIAARNAAANAQDQLKSLLGFDEQEEWRTVIETTEDLAVKPITPHLGESIDIALSSRPEIRQQLLAIEAARLNRDVAKNSALPRLDLQGSYGFSGLGGDVRTVDPETGQTLSTIPGGLDDAVRQIRDLDFPHWTVGVSFSVPLGNNDAEAQLARRRYELEQALTRLRALKQDTIREVREAVRDLEDGAANIEAAAAARRLAERNLEAEQTKLANGLSTNYQILEIQEDLAQAQLTELSAQVGYRQALTSYLVATGQLLDHEGIRVADPGAPDVPHDFWGDVEWLQFTNLKEAALLRSEEE